MANLTKPQFIAVLLPHVQRVRREGSPMFPSVRLAQNLLETGGVLHPWNNLGGIKVGTGTPNAFWKGQWVRKGTWEVENGTRVDTAANFRAYESVYHFYKDQDLLFALARYARVRAAKSPAEQAEALRLCGYATDPQYATKITSIINTYKLDQYDAPDVPEMEDEDELKLSANEKTMLINALNKLAAAETIGKEWAEKAEKGELTLSQLTWLNTIIMARK